MIEKPAIPAPPAPPPPPLSIYDKKRKDNPFATPAYLSKIENNMNYVTLFD